MTPIRTVFFGTHEFARTILEGLIEHPLFDVVLVITQPDRPVGRKQLMTPPPVKVLAEKHGIAVVQPESLKQFTVPGQQADINIVAQYGLLIPESILESATYGTINTHTSLLPKYRGASPIQSALMAGETETGVTIMKMDKGLDTGPILLQKPITIAPDDTYQSLDAKLAPIALEGLIEAVPAYISGDLSPTPQDDSKATLCGKLTRESGRIDWTAAADTIYNLYRGLTPWPGVWTTWNGKRVKLLGMESTDRQGIDAGHVVTEQGRLLVGTGTDVLAITRLQLEGKSATDAAVFLQGNAVIHGQLFS